MAYKILIVDDDLLFRTQVKGMIEQQIPGYTVSGQASNGAEALELLRIKLPDLVITDVEMPDMDGVGLIRRMKELGMDIPTIVLSNFDSYRYVKDTLKNGAMDYILKHEMDVRLLKEQLGRAVQRIEEKSRYTHRKQEIDAETYVRKSMTALKNEFLNRLLSARDLDEDTIQKHMDILDIQLGTKRLMTCLMILNHYPQESQSMTPDQVSLRDYAVLNVTEEILRDSGNGFVGNLGGGQFLLLFSFDNQRSEAQVHTRTNEIIGRLSFCMKSYLNENPSFCLDQKLRDILHIRQGYAYTKKLQTKRFFYRDNCVLQEDIEDMDDPLTGLSAATENRILYAMEQGSGYEELLQSIFFKMENRQTSLSNAKMEIYDLFSILNRFSKKHQVSLEWVYGQAWSIEDIWRRFETVMDAREFFVSTFHRLCNTVQMRQEVSVDSHYVKQVIRTVREHYGQELSLAEIAESLGISQGYLSKIFKEEVGMGFSNYLTDIRLQKSIQLMQTHKYMLYEIAQMCGFREYTYFTNVFKRKTGKTPREYLNQLEDC